MRKILKIDAVNRIKAEKANEFDDSIFSEVYQRTSEMVMQIIASNEKYESWEEHSLEKFINENQISNVISFLGERGMGKSSVMLSFAYYLKTFYQNDDLVKNKYRVTIKDNQGFCVLSKIDAAMIGAGENLLDIVLAKMWDDYTVRMDNQGVCKYLRENIRNELSDVKSLYSEYQNFSKNATKLEKNSDLSELHTLSRSLNLRKKFAELVACYLESFKEISKDNYLVICIDDLDIVKDGTYDILEQIRMFLTIPKVIIMVTADIERLTLDISSIFSEKLISSHNKKEEYIDMVHTYSGDYLSKILPINMRIYMPFFNAAYTEVSIYQEELYSLVYNDSNQEMIDERRLIKDIIAKYMGILLPSEYMSNENKSLRNVVNGIDEVKNIIRGENRNDLLFQWMRKQIVIANNDIDISLFFKKFIKSLLKINESNYNYYIVNALAEYYKNIEDFGNYGYGHTILQIGKILYLERNLIWMLLWMYSALISKMIQDNRFEDLEKKIIQDDIFSSIMENDKVYVGWENSINIAPFVHLKLIDATTVDDIINNEDNAKNIVDSFKMLLFYEFDYTIDYLRENNSGIVVHEEQELLIGEKKEVVPQKHEVLEIKFKALEGITSLDNYFRNIMHYDKKWNCYWDKIYRIINKKKIGTDKVKIETSKEIQKLVKLDEFLSWKDKYNVDNITDLLPIQSVGVMIQIVKQLHNYVQYKPWINKNNYKQCTNTIIDILQRAEEEYDLDNLKREDLRYSKKLGEILEIVDIESITSDKFDLLQPVDETEDTTM